jgi:hypothetical protein
MEDIMTRRRQDIIGKKFGKWTVLSRTTHELPSGKPVFMATCRCECGTVRDVVVAHLVRGNSRSCGCEKSHYLKLRGTGNAKFNGYKDISGTIWNHIRKGAAIRKIEFTVSIENAWQLYETQERKCALTRLPIKFDRFCAESTASLDRIDSSKDYTLDNVWWVHKDVNIMKNIYTVEYFVDLCRLVADNAAKSATDSVVVPQNCGASFGKKKDQSLS